MNRRSFIKKGALFVPFIFIPRLVNSQIILKGATLKGGVIGTTNSPSGGGGGSNPFITAISGGSTASAFTGRAGFEFQPSVNITVTDLGYFVNTGNTGTRVIYLMDSEVACTDITNGTTGDVTGLAGTWVYASITPTVLTSGTKYQIMVQTISGQAYHNDDSTSLTTTSDAAITVSTYKDTSCHTNTNFKAFGFCNFKYHL